MPDNASLTGGQATASGGVTTTMDPDAEADIGAYFPTTAWLERYGRALDADERLSSVGADWGVGWNGDLVLEMRDLPVDRRTVGDLPSDLRAPLVRGIETMAESDLRRVVDEAPATVRSRIDAREGTLAERAAAELMETTLADAPGVLWPELERLLPQLHRDLLAELTESIADDGAVYAWVGLSGGGCDGVATLDTRDERPVGFVLAGAYDTWVEVVRGDRGVIDCVVAGDLDLDGDRRTVLRHTDAVRRIGEVASEVEKTLLF